MTTTKTTRLPLKMGLLAPMALTSLAVAPHAWADSLLLSQSTFVVGSEKTTDTFTAPTAGTVTVTLNSLDWASTLASLSFTASSATQTLATWSASGVTSGTATFAVGPGDYFANIIAQSNATGMDMGMYSLSMTFSPNATPPVPLPSSGWLLLTGMFVLAGLARAVRPLELMGTAEA